MEIRVGRNFRIIKRLGSGSFGEIWQGLDVITGHEVAIKLEHMKRTAPHLLNETKINKILEGCVGVPRIHWYGCQGDYVVLVMDLLGPSIEDLFTICDRQLCISTVSMIGSQMIDRLETCHNRGVIHRDIKPHNFLMGKNQTDKTVCIIDFGLAKRYKHIATGIHIPYKEGKQLTGTARYTSVSTHLGVEQSRRDDLESVGYVLLYLLKGSLPWQGLKAANKKEKYERIMTKKLLTPLDILCRGYPHAMQNYIAYCRALKFVERPDYSWLRDALRSLFYFDPLILQAAQFDADKAVVGAIAPVEQARKESKVYQAQIKPPLTNRHGSGIVMTRSFTGDLTTASLGSANSSAECHISGDSSRDLEQQTTSDHLAKDAHYNQVNKDVLLAINICREYEWTRREREYLMKQFHHANQNDASCDANDGDFEGSGRDHEQCGLVCPAPENTME